MKETVVTARVKRGNPTRMLPINNRRNRLAENVEHLFNSFTFLTLVLDRENAAAGATKHGGSVVDFSALKTGFQEGNDAVFFYSYTLENDAIRTHAS